TLRGEGFRPGEVRNDHVAVAHLHAERTEAVGVNRVALNVHRFVVDPQRFVQIHVVPHHHFVLTDHGNLAYFARVEPTGVNVGQHAVGVCETGDNDIFNCGIEVRLAMRRHG